MDRVGKYLNSGYIRGDYFDWVLWPGRALIVPATPALFGVVRQCRFPTRAGWIEPFGKSPPRPADPWLQW